MTDIPDPTPDPNRVPNRAPMPVPGPDPGPEPGDVPGTTPGPLPGPGDPVVMSGVAQPRASFDPRMLEALVCPRTHGPLAWDAARSELVSRSAHLAYPVRDGIPIMLLSEARAI